MCQRLNKRHMLFAWLSLFVVGFADVYVRLGARWACGRTIDCYKCWSSAVRCIVHIPLVSGLLLLVGLACFNQRTTNSVATTNQRNNAEYATNANYGINTQAISATNQNANLKSVSNQAAESTFRIPADSVPAVQITLDFDDKRSDLKAAVGKWRHKRVTFHGTVYTFEKGDNGKFKISLTGHDSFFTVYCRDIPASQASLVAKFKEDQTVIAITGVILGNGITGLVPGHVDHDVIAEKCKIVE